MALRDRLLPDTYRLLPVLEESQHTGFLGFFLLAEQARANSDCLIGGRGAAATDLGFHELLDVLGQMGIHIADRGSMIPADGVSAWRGAAKISSRLVVR